MEEFDALNDQLQESATKANVNANTLMPIMMNLLNVQYVDRHHWEPVCHQWCFWLTVGMIASFLQLSRSLNGPISQVSQQINFVIMALAGAERIFHLLDETPEIDHGYVTLVNAKWSQGQLKPKNEQARGRGNIPTRMEPLYGSDGRRAI